MSERVLITCRQMQSCFEDFSEKFEAANLEVVQPEIVQQPSEEELIEWLPGVAGMIAGDDPISARVLESADELRILVKWGIGMDGIDHDAAERLGIPVRNTPAMFGEEVADVAMAYIVMLARQLHRIHAAVLAGEWLKVEGSSISGKSIGVVGFGDIGAATARRAAAFGMSVLVDDVSGDARQAATSLGYETPGLDGLLEGADYVVLCCPLTKENRHMIDAEAMRRMKRGSSLVNVARGPLVDETALAEALGQGHLSGAALDVFEQEPLPDASPLRQFESCVFGSHNGSNTSAGVLRASTRAAEILLEGLGDR